MSNSHKVRRTHTGLSLVGILALFAIAGMLGGCSSGSPTPTPTSTPLPTPTPTPLPAITGNDVTEARSRLVTRGVTASELTEACSYYAANGWAFTDAWNATIGVAPQRTTDVITDVSIVVEEIATPTEWVVSIAESIGKPLAEWTEADNDTYDSAIITRKRQVIEPLCTQ